MNTAHPDQVTETGTYIWNDHGGSFRSKESDPNWAAAYAAANGTPAPSSIGLGTAGSGSANNTINIGSTFATRPDRGPAPLAPDLTGLRSLQTQVGRKKSIADAMKAYDALDASTRAQGFQAAENAGTSYANRVMQGGGNPLAAGVVAAQAKIPVYGQLAENEVQREKTRLDAANKADALSAQIASTIAGLQTNYADSLAKFNATQVGVDLDLNKFNASQASSDRDREAKLEIARLNSGSSGGGAADAAALYAAKPEIYPGYIPNSGPITPGRINGIAAPGMTFTPSAIQSLGARIGAAY